MRTRTSFFLRFVLKATSHSGRVASLRRVFGPHEFGEELCAKPPSLAGDKSASIVGRHQSSQELLAWSESNRWPLPCQTDKIDLAVAQNVRPDRPRHTKCQILIVDIACLEERACVLGAGNVLR